MIIKRVETKKTYWNPRGIVYLVKTSDGQYITMFTRLKDAKEFINFKLSDNKINKLLSQYETRIEND